MIPLSEDTFCSSFVFDFLRWNIVLFINYNFQCFLNQRLDQQIPKYPVWLISTGSSSWNQRELFSSSSLFEAYQIVSLTVDEHELSVDSNHFSENSIDPRVYWSATIRTAETCDDFIAHKTLPCCFQLVSSFAPPNGRGWCWGEGCLWDTETGSQFSAFHPRPPPLAPCLCWRTSSQLPGHVHGAKSGLITVYTWRSQLFWETRKMWTWDKYQPGQSDD